MVGHPRRLFLIRHGESAGNVANATALARGLEELALAGRDMDVPLSELGREQARALGSWFRSIGAVDVVYTSPYRRARETAAIALEHAGSTVEVVCDERLREREFGVLDRLTKAGIEARHPEQAAARAFLGKLYHRPPGGESWVDVAARVRAFYADVRLDHTDDTVVVVAHQAVILLFRYALERIAEDDLLAIDRAEEIVNTAVTSYAGDGRGRPALVNFNDASHLDASLRTDEPDRPVAPR